MAHVEGLEGRWEKIAAVLLWKYAKDGVTLSTQDLGALPQDRVLLVTAHGREVEFRFVSIEEAQRIRKWEAENEGRDAASWKRT